MRIKKIHQTDFSGNLFDILFGMTLFFDISYLLNIQNRWHLVFYAFCFFIIIHWWIVFECADDAFDEEVEDSATDLVFGIFYLVLLNYIVSLSRDFNYQAMLGILLALLLFDFGWLLIWRYVGKWRTEDKAKIKRMEEDLGNNIFINFIAIGLFFLLLVPTYLSLLTIPWFVGLFIAIYVFYIILSFHYRIINIKIF